MYDIRENTTELGLGLLTHCAYMHYIASVDLLRIYEIVAFDISLRCRMYAIAKNIA